MERVGVRELRQNASALLRRVAAGESIVVTDRGRPVARLSPVHAGGGLAELRAAGLVRDASKRMRDASPALALTPGMPTASEVLSAARADER